MSLLKSTLLASLALASLQLCGAEAGPDGLSYLQLKTLAMNGSLFYQAAFSMACWRGDLAALKDYEAAAKWAKESSGKDEPLGLFSMAVLYEGAMGVAADKEKAGELFKRALPGLERLSGEGDFRSQYALGCMLFSGKGAPQDKARAAKLFEAAAGAGDGHAACMLGQMLQRGEGVEQNSAKAMEWLLKAAEADDSQAQCLLGMTYLKGMAAGQNLQEAAKWLLKAAENGNPDAQFLMGSLLESGKLGSKDMSKALQYYHRAALQGNQYAKKRLKDFANEVREVLDLKPESASAAADSSSAHASP